MPGVAELVGKIAVVHEGEGQPKADVGVVGAGKLERRGRDVGPGGIVVAVGDLVGRRRFDHGDGGLAGQGEPGVVAVPQVGERHFVFDDVGGPEADADAVKELGDAGLVDVHGMARQEGVGQELAEEGQLVHYAGLPGCIEHGRVILDAVLVGVDVDGVAPDVELEPGLGGHDVVEEYAVVHEAAVEQEPVGIAGLVLGHVELGQVEAVDARPDLDL